jgi:hypothetical protein
MSPTAEQLKAAITQGGFKPRTYSGRGMFGVYCVGVNLDSPEDLVGIGVALGKAGLEVGTPLLDSMGLGVVAYWPAIQVSEQATA